MIATTVASQVTKLRVAGPNHGSGKGTGQNHRNNTSQNKQLNLQKSLDETAHDLFGTLQIRHMLSCKGPSHLQRSAEHSSRGGKGEITQSHDCLVSKTYVLWSSPDGPIIERAKYK